MTDRQINGCNTDVVIDTETTRKPSWCWHTRATQKRCKKLLHFEVI